MARRSCRFGWAQPEREAKPDKEIEQIEFAAQYFRRRRWNTHKTNSSRASWARARSLARSRFKAAVVVVGELADRMGAASGLANRLRVLI